MSSITIYLEKPLTKNELQKIQDKFEKVTPHVIQEIKTHESNFLGQLRKVVQMYQVQSVPEGLKTLYAKEKYFVDRLHDTLDNLRHVVRLYTGHGFLFDECSAFMVSCLSTDYANTKELMRLVFTHLTGLKLLFERLLKYQEKLQGPLLRPLQGLMETFTKYLTKCNNENAIYSIQNLPEDIRKLENFLLRETFQVNKRKKCVFLFENTMIFTTQGLHYEFQITMDEISFNLQSANTIWICNYPSYKENPENFLILKHSKPVIIQNWCKKLEDLILQQLTEVKRLSLVQNKIKQPS